MFQIQYNQNDLTLNFVLGAGVLYLLSLCSDFLLVSDIWKNPSKYVIVITGCDSGFGESAAKSFSSRGFHVVATCLTKEGVDRLSGKVALAVLCDVTKKDDVEDVLQHVIRYTSESNTRLGVVINNAGVAILGSFDWQTVDAIRQMIEVNFMGMVSITKAFLPLLKQTRGSRIINLSSIAGLSTGAGFSGYCATKHAVEGFMNSLRIELKAWGIYVSNINPGFMRTPMVTNAMVVGRASRFIIPEVRAQYSNEEEVSFKYVNLIAEDPMKVVRAMESLVRSYRPPPRVIVGVLAKILRFMVSVTPEVVMDILNYSLQLTSFAKPEVMRRIQGQTHEERP